MKIVSVKKIISEKNGATSIQSPFLQIVSGAGDQSVQINEAIWMVYI